MNPKLHIYNPHDICTRAVLLCTSTKHTDSSVAASTLGLSNPNDTDVNPHSPTTLTVLLCEPTQVSTATVSKMDARIDMAKLMADLKVVVADLYGYGESIGKIREDITVETAEEDEEGNLQVCSGAGASADGSFC